MNIEAISPYRAGLILSSVRLLTSSFSFVYLLGVGLSVAEVSSVRLLQLLALVLLEVPCGVLADKLGPRVALLWATGLSSLWLGAMALVDDLPTLILAEFLNALSISLFSGAFEVLLRDTHKAKNPIANFGRTQALWIAAASLAGAGFATLVSRQAAWLLAAVIQAGLFGVLWRDVLRAQPSDAVRMATPSTVLSRLAVGARTIRGLPVSLLVSFAAPTVVYDVVLQFWQPIVITTGISSKSNFGLVLVSLALMLAMSAGNGVEEMSERRWLLPAAVALVPVASIGILVADGGVVVALTLLPILLLITAATAMRARATYQLTHAVRGDVEVAAFSAVSAIARILSGLVIFGVGAVLEASGHVAVVLVMLALLLSVCFVVGHNTAGAHSDPIDLEKP